MYGAGQISLAQAPGMAGLPRMEFQRELGRRVICVNYDLEDLAVDLKAAAELNERL